MSWARIVAWRLRALFGRKRQEQALEDEVRFHLEMQVEDNIHAGMDEAEARWAARRSFGAIEPMKESYRDKRAFTSIETLAQDIRFAVRTLRKSPGFTVTSVAILALAIGADTAMFSVLHAVLLRPLPYRSPDQLAMLWTEIAGQREIRSALANVEQWRAQSASFVDMAVFDPASVTLTNEGEGEQITVGRVSPNFFSLLGVPPLRGRAFSDAEAEQRQHLAIITDRFWQARFGRSAAAIGSNIELDGIPSRIIGILPAGFRFAQLDADVWEPATLFANQEARRGANGSESWFVIGRLRPNATLQRAQAEMNAIARRLDEQAPPSRRNREIRVVPLSVQTTGPRARLALWMLTGAVFGVLLIAASNVASLSLARSVGREREIAVRAALGASRWRIARQLLVESLALAILSGTLGLLVAQGAIRVILASRPGNLARLDQIGLDPVVLSCALGLCLLSGILVGLMPAITLARRGAMPSAQEGGRSISNGAGMRRTRRALVATEFALAIMLLAGAGLLVRSLWSVQNVNPGFRPEGVLALQISSPAFPATAQRTELYSRVLEQVEALSGVESAGMIGDLFIGNNPPEQTVSTAGGSRTISGLKRDEVSSGLFRTLNTPLLRGRFFSGEDGPESPRVAIVNETMARRLWPGRDPVGQRFRLSSGEFTVVGMVRDLRRQGLESAPMPQMFEPLAQSPSRHEVLLVRTRGDNPLAMAGTIEAAVHGVEKRAVVYHAETLENLLGAYLEERRFQTSLLIGFSAIALLMAAIGIYGLIQYSIVTRTHEIGIRMAVGAQAGEIFRMILSEGLKLSLMGLAAGLIGALWLGRVGSSLLFGVTPWDPLTFLGVSLLLTAVAMAACCFPARRAMRIEPITALRQD